MTSTKITKKTSKSTARRKSSILDNLSTSEVETIFRTLLRRHKELVPEAEELAVELTGEASMEDVADDVFDRMTSLEIDELNGRAGRTADGYVDPTEAAWDICDEEIEDLVRDMHRRADLGQVEASVEICCGIVQGLRLAWKENCGGLLDYAEDFPVERGGSLVNGLLGRLSKTDAKKALKMMEEMLDGHVPGWSGHLTKNVSPTRKKKSRQ